MSAEDERGGGAKNASIQWATIWKKAHGGKKKNIGKVSQREGGIESNLSFFIVHQKLI